MRPKEDEEERLALRLSSSVATTSRWPAREAKQRQLSEPSARSRITTLAFASSSTRAVPAWPLVHAIIVGVSPPNDCFSTDAPALRSASTICVCPCAAAIISAVRPAASTPSMAFGAACSLRPRSRSESVPKVPSSILIASSPRAATSHKRRSSLFASVERAASEAAKTPDDACRLSRPLRKSSVATGSTGVRGEFGAPLPAAAASTAAPAAAPAAAATPLPPCACLLGDPCARAFELSITVAAERVLTPGGGLPKPPIQPATMSAHQSFAP